MAQGKECHKFEEETTAETDGKSETKSHHVQVTQPSKDLNRYLVDKFHLPTTKSKSAPFEAIDLSIYRPSAKCLAFSTSEDRLLLWITAFQYRYHELTGNAADFKVTWAEQDSPSSASKCDKIIIHLTRFTSTGEEQLVTITVYLTTGRIQIQGKKYEEWSKFEFPVLLNIVKTLNDQQPRFTQFDNSSLFRSSLHNFFGNLIQFVGDDDIPSSNTEKKNSCDPDQPTEMLTTPSEDLTVSPTRLKTIASMRDTLGQLEAEFTQFQIITSGDLDNIKDKIAKQDNLVKLQKQAFNDLHADMSSQIKSLQEMITHQSQATKALQDENQSLQKKLMQITKSNQILQESESKLATEIAFLKEQMTALCENSTDDKHVANPTDAIQQPETCTSSEDITPSITAESRSETPKPQTKEIVTPPNIVTPNIPTKNRFLPLQNSMNESDTLPSREEIDQTPKINSPKPRDNNVLPVKTPPTVVNKAVFLCDSNGKFLDKRKLFPPGQDFTFCRSPTIAHVRTILQDEINQEPEHPQLILIHSGTNDLTPTTPIDDFISDISVLVTQASTMFPKSKIIYSTLIPRADIPLQTLSKINMKLIDSLSTLPNVHLVTHENIFSKGTDILHDTKHLKKRHLGLFAANLVAAVRGRAKTKTLRSPSNPVHHSPPSTSRPQYTTPMEVPGFFSHAVKNSQNRTYPTPRTQQPSPLCSSYVNPSEGYPSYSDAVKHSQTSRDPLPSNIQNSPLPTIVNSSASHQPNQSGMTGVEIPKELVSLLRFIKTLL